MQVVTRGGVWKVCGVVGPANAHAHGVMRSANKIKYALGLHTSSKTRGKYNTRLKLLELKILPYLKLNV